MEALFSLLAFAAFAVLWGAFGYAVVARPGGIDEAWKRLRALPLVIQALVALLLLPVVVGLWVWRARWPAAVRVPVVALLAAWTLVIFFPGFSL